ncbi:hypothetical protein [Tunturiibacter lichenicola]|uniref:hypothetical protein n=1 Tax=Tunturiibacter lichenicola TaxID=2051959 RepID=UPI003D9B6C20
MLAYVRRLDSSLDIPVSQSLLEAKTGAFALLLFRYTMEQWNDLRSFSHPRSSHWSTPHHTFAIPMEAVGVRLYRVGRLCSPVEVRWLMDHFFIEAIRGVFAEGFFRAGAMVRSGKYFLENLSQAARHTQPYSVGTFDRNGRLGFWSLRLNDRFFRAGVEGQGQKNEPESVVLEGKLASET